MKTFLRFPTPAILLLLVLSAFRFSATDEKKQPVFVTDSLDTYINREIKSWNLPGLAIAIVKDGKVVVSKGYGLAEQNTAKKVDDETLFQVASCTKAFTATSLAMLDYQKKLSLDDTVRKWMPAFKLYDPLATKEVTIRDLLCHRIGLQTFQGDFANWDSDMSRGDIISLLSRNKPVYGFREKFGYCNAAFLAAGEIIPLATHQSWDDFVKKNLFDPLDMKRTSTTYAALTADANACKPHTRWHGSESVMAYDNIDNLAPAGSVNSCAKDFSHWLLMQLDSGRYNGKHVVPFEALSKTREPQTIIGSSATSNFVDYALGWFVADYHGTVIYYHNGGASGFLSTTCFVPSLNLGFVVLTNSDNNGICNALRNQLLDAYLGLPYVNYSAKAVERNKTYEQLEEKQHKSWRDSIALKPALPVAAENFAGIYENPVYGKMNVTVDAGKLGATFEHHGKYFAALEYMGNNRFLCTFNTPLWGYKPAPFKIKNGKVESITISVSDNVDMMSYEFVKK